MDGKGSDDPFEELGFGFGLFQGHLLLVFVSSFFFSPKTSKLKQLIFFKEGADLIKPCCTGLGKKNPRKLRGTLKRNNFKGYSIFQLSILRGYVSFQGGKQSPVAFLKELLILISRRRKGDALAIPLLRRLELADFEAWKKQGLFLSETVVPGGYV